MSKVALLPFLLLAACPVFGDIAATLERIDLLHDQGNYAEARSLALDTVAGAEAPAERAELYWRASRETMKIGQRAEAARVPTPDVLRICEEGERYADAAIDADPRGDLGYYWKAASVGRWAQTKGMMNALFKTGAIRDILAQELGVNPDRSDAYTVLCQLYRELPGWPISFGSVDAAVSLGREAVDLRVKQYRAGVERSLDYSFPVELAKSLWRRNWSASARVKAQDGRRAAYDSAKTPLEKGFAYESVVTLAPLSDREEARLIVRQAIADLEALRHPTVDDNETLSSARALVKGW